MNIGDLKVFDLGNTKLSTLDDTNKTSATGTRTLENIKNMFPVDLIHSSTDYPRVYLGVNAVDLKTDDGIVIVSKNPGEDFAFYLMSKNIIVVSESYSDFEDVIMHEFGHFLLNKLNSKFSNLSTFTINATHEGFADILSIIQEAEAEAISLSDPLLETIISNHDHDLWVIGDDHRHPVRKHLGTDQAHKTIYTEGNILVRSFIEAAKKTSLANAFDDLVYILIHFNYASISELVYLYESGGGNYNEHRKATLSPIPLYLMVLMAGVFTYILFIR
jgi:hypothetical protein